MKFIYPTRIILVVQIDYIHVSCDNADTPVSDVCVGVGGAPRSLTEIMVLSRWLLLLLQQAC